MHNNGLINMWRLRDEDAAPDDHVKIIANRHEANENRQDVT